ncbi:MAG TPA: GIDE domain-containing protein [Roseiflexaceae bacterium]|nr:GIDE domain-containing protein [Roseiflexaceae bacterium]
MTTQALILIGGSVLLFITALACIIAAEQRAGRLAAMHNTKPYTAQAIAQIHQQIARGSLREGWGYACEITGMVECDTAILTPQTQQTCVAYSHAVMRETWQKLGAFDHRRAHDSDGWVKTDSSNTYDLRHVPTFRVRDATGCVLVDPAFADFDLEQRDKHYEVMSFSIGEGEYRTWHDEKALETGRTAYVLGYLADRDGQPILMRHPSNTHKKFIVSYRTEQELAKATGGAVNGFYFAAGLSGGIALILLVLLFVRF